MGLFKFVVFFFCFSISIAGTGQADFDIIIKNGKLVDGSGNPWFVADIGIRDGKITEVGHLQESAAEAYIDAAGLVVCPGFIDVHTHIESSLPQRPQAENFLYDGVTSLITGNCGGSSIDLNQFFNDLMKVGISPNVGSLIGHNSVRRKVMGSEDRAPQAEEMQDMKKLVEQAMDAGAVGLSTGLIYIPGAFAETGEIVELAKVTGRYRGIYASHIRQEDERVFDAIREACNIGQQANIPVEISHFKITGKVNWNQTQRMIDLVEQYRRQGIDVTVDQYPYTASSTRLDVLMPEWSRAGGRNEIKSRLSDAAAVKKIKGEMKQMLKNTGFKDYSYCFVANCRWQASYNGKNISEINRLMGRRGKVKDEIQTILDMMAKGGGSMVYHKMYEEDVQRIMRYPNAMVASDAGVPAFDVGAPHPRAYGTNARVLGRYVREMGTISLPLAIRKMTSLPAQRFQLKDRGLIRPGMAADIVIFDEQKIGDRATFEAPHAFSTGIQYVLVNGIPVLEKGVHNGKRPGVILKGPGAKEK